MTGPSLAPGPAKSPMSMTPPHRHDQWARATKRSPLHKTGAASKPYTRAMSFALGSRSPTSLPRGVCALRTLTVHAEDSGDVRARDIRGKALCNAQISYGYITS